MSLRPNNSRYYTRIAARTLLCLPKRDLVDHEDIWSMRGIAADAPPLDRQT